MSKVDAVVLKETKYIALVVLILSALMEAVFLIIGKWNYTVLLGNLLGGGVGILNFFLMGLGLQKALDKGDAKDARVTANFSHTMRNFMIIVVLAAGVLLNCFNTVAVIVSLFFSSLGIYIKYFITKKNEVPSSENDNNEEVVEE